MNCILQIIIIVFLNNYTIHAAAASPSSMINETEAQKKVAISQEVSAFLRQWEISRLNFDNTKIRITDAEEQAIKRQLVTANVTGNSLEAIKIAARYGTKISPNLLDWMVKIAKDSGLYAEARELYLLEIYIGVVTRSGRFPSLISAGEILRESTARYITTISKDIEFINSQPTVTSQDKRKKMTPLKIIIRAVFSSALKLLPN